MRIDELERELREVRPESDPEFARRLDEWAADGFPRDRGLGPHALGPGRLGFAARAWSRLAAIPPRRTLLPVGAAATFLVVIGVVVSRPGDVVEPSGGGEDAAVVAEPSGGDAGSAPAIEDTVAPAPAAAQKDVFRAEDGGASAELVAPENSLSVEEFPIPGGDGDKIARGTDERLVDATAQITLGAEADEVQDVANEVVAVTDAHDGVVIDSRVTTDEAGARASFELEIPYRELDATIGDLSGLADVISRTEQGEDITARAVRAQKDLADTLERLRDARIELIEADTREERLIAKARIDSLNAQANAFEQQRNDVRRQARFATVNVDVTSDGAEGAEDDWSLADALDDAGRVVEVIGGIALVTLAVLVPVALVGAIVWLIAARARRHGRERALDT